METHVTQLFERLQGKCVYDHVFRAGAGLSTTTAFDVKVCELPELISIFDGYAERATELRSAACKAVIICFEGLS